mgnify:CR=1 FL=1
MGDGFPIASVAGPVQGMDLAQYGVKYKCKIYKVSESRGITNNCGLGYEGPYFGTGDDLDFDLSQAAS